MGVFKVLVVEDEIPYQETLKLLLEKRFDLSVVTAGSLAEAKNAFANTGDIELVISDYDIGDGTGSDVYDLLESYNQQHEKQIPFVLCSSLPPSDYSTLEGKSLSGFVLKPNISRAISSYLQRFIEQRSDVASARDQEFTEVSVYSLLHAGNLICDVYLRLNSEKFVRLVHKGGEFTEADYSRYVNKDVSTLYIPKNELTAFLKQFSQSLEQFAQEDVDLNMAVHVSQKGAEAIRFLSQNFGWSEEVVRMTRTNVAVVVNLIEKTPQLKTFLQFLNEERQETEYGSRLVLPSYLAAGIASALDWKSSSTFYKLTMAAMLHDVPLSDGQVENEAELEAMIAEGRTDSAEVKQYMQHPIEAAQIAEEISEHAYDVSQIITQHHERPDGSGFPHGIAGTKITPLAAVFIVTEDLCRDLWGNLHKETIERVLADAGQKYTSGYFRKAYHRLSEDFKSAQESA